MKCAWCEGKLDEEETETPSKSKCDEILCDTCYDDEYRIICSLCGNMMDKPETVEEGYFYMLTQDMGGNDVIGNNLKKGIYQIIEFPFFADGMTEGHFYSNSFKFIRNLTKKELKHIKENNYNNCEICEDCKIQRCRD